MKAVLLFLIVAPALLRADGLTDLRATLAKLQSDQPLRARVEIKASSSGGESDKQKQQADGTSAVIAELGPAGLRLNWTPEQIKQSRKAAWEKVANPDAAKSNLATLGALDASEALNFLDAADQLRRWVEGATLLEDKSDPVEGKSARLLVLQVDLRMNAEARKVTKSSDAILKVWLDSNGVPLALDRSINVRFSKFFLSYRVREHDAREFQTSGGRLVVTRATHESSGSGLGHSEESHATTTVTLLSD